MVLLPPASRLLALCLLLAANSSFSHSKNLKSEMGNSKPAKNAIKAAQPDLMPIPSQVAWGEGRLVLNSRFSIEASGPANPRIQVAVRRTLQRLQDKTGLKFISATTGAAKGGSGKAAAAARETKLFIQYDSAGLPVQSVKEDESYTLHVTAKQARLSAPNPLGVLRGLETFLQLVRKDRTLFVVPAVNIDDRPRFQWRGLLIDVCRHWEPMEVLKRNLDGMAAVKMNVLHWHLTEDQGFRVESKRFPRLHQLGSDGKYFTQDQVREVIAYARNLGIRVVPEFDMPGHTTSWLVGHPEIAAAPGPYHIARTWGIFDSSFDPTREEVYQLIDGFLGEMAALFPDEYMHIGGDEVNGKQWNANPKIQDFMREHNLRGNHDLQAYFNSRLSPILTKYGKKMVGWDEILHPDLPKNIVVQSWRGPVALAKAAKDGYDGILSYGYYLDLALPASLHYASDPIPAGSDLNADQRKHILGGEACMWGEYVSPETIDSRIWPRNAAVAERLWSPVEVQDLEDMYRRLEIESARLEELGLTHRSNYPVMLQRLVGEGNAIGPIKILADVVEPVKYYSRGSTRQYTQDTPLNRLVDAARPESILARNFRKSVDQFLRNAPSWGNPADFRTALTTWKNNDKILQPLFGKSELAAEAAPLSKYLSSLGELGLDSLDSLISGKQTPSSWQEGARQILDSAQKPQAEVFIAIVPAVRKLVLASGQTDKLKTVPAVEWNAQLDAQVEAATPKAKE
jgi:hexosaminidase